MTIERLKTGIKGFDQLVEGGIPRGYQIMVSGLAGTGKTIFTLETLYRGAKEFNEPCIYAVIGEDNEKVIRDQAERFNWDLDKTPNFKLLVIPVTENNFDLVSRIKEEAAKMGAKRIGIDSLSALTVNSILFERGMANKLMEHADYAVAESLDPKYNGGATQHLIYLFIANMQAIGATVFYVTDLQANGESKDGVSEYVGDGLIKLSTIEFSGGPVRVLKIEKLRSTKTPLEYFGLVIGSNGLETVPLSKWLSNERLYKK